MRVGVENRYKPGGTKKTQLFKTWITLKVSQPQTRVLPLGERRHETNLEQRGHFRVVGRHLEQPQLRRHRFQLPKKKPKPLVLLLMLACVFLGCNFEEKTPARSSLTSVL
jgi:hypothetical protein